jgi:5'-methylthioadenosine phosphorylase
MPAQLKVGLIGGSGLGSALGSQTTGTRHEIDTPFGKPSDAIVETEWAGVPVLFLSRHGPGHRYNPTQVPYRANIFALKQLGCTHIIASGAVGSLREEFKPRDLVIPEQIIDKTKHRPDTFYARAAVHVEFAEPFCPVLRRILLDAATERRSDEATEGNSNGNSPSPLPFAVHHRGCYVCMEGPAFSTRAESLLHRIWGGDLIGMTAMPEAKLAKEAEISYVLVALVTDYDCWRTPTAAAHAQADPSVLLQEIIANLHAATDNAIALMKRAVELIGQRREELMQAPALNALKLAIWSDKSQIDPAEVQRLAPLWMRYFERREGDTIEDAAGVADGETPEPDVSSGAVNDENVKT